MKQGNEEYIQFEFQCQNPTIAGSFQISRLNLWRKELQRRNLIGVDRNGIGYGNLSVRVESESEFVITGTQTSGLQEINSDHYAKVVSFNFEEYSLTYEGKTKPSSESMTHAAIYSSLPEINSVIHVHSEQIWKRYLGKLPTSAAHIANGSQEMKDEVERLVSQSSLLNERIMVMGGHQNGIIAFGKDLDQAGERLLRALA